MQQVTDRLDCLIMQIRKIQAPYMHGEKAIDVVLVCVFFIHLFIHLVMENQNDSDTETLLLLLLCRLPTV